MAKFFEASKIQLTGNPVRAALLQNLDEKKQEAAEFFGLDASKPTLFVMGGSLGARTLNNALRSALSVFAQSDVQVIWQCGKSFEQELLNFQQTLPKNVKVFPFIQRMDLAYAIATVIVSRAGALSVSELALVAKPAILVPSPNVAEDHQTKNARALVERSAALLVTDAQAQEKLVPLALALLQDPAQQQALSEAMKTMALPNATIEIVDACLKVARI
jgi:UDP-N-acetylglucosamine--N-acetylmuramyl-(pentapeptide) pyrophosphoryl-undecaprenol N-acetylglucosamine transferase